MHLILGIQRQIFEDVCKRGGGPTLQTQGYTLRLQGGVAAPLTVNRTER